MKAKIFSIFFCCSLISLNYSNLFSQKCNQDNEFINWLNHYKHTLYGKTSSPLLAEDSSMVKFYEYQPKFSFLAQVKLIETNEPIKFFTSSDKIKTFEKYAILTFEYNSFYYTLTAYRSGNDTATLFIPFKDGTNGITTYDGGRYLDIKLSEIKDGTVCLDFNKAYNPYCAFATGYSCPKPPEDNYLNLEINAGAMQYLGVIRSKIVD